MQVGFEEISVLDRGPLPDDYRVMVDAVSALNDPPNFKAAQTSYLFKLDEGAIVQVWPSENPVQTMFDFIQAGGWSYALIPYSILRDGAVSSYSVISKR